MVPDVAADLGWQVCEADAADTEAEQRKLGEAAQRATRAAPRSFRPAAAGCSSRSSHGDGASAEGEGGGERASFFWADEAAPASTVLSQKVTAAPTATKVELSVSPHVAARAVVRVRAVARHALEHAKPAGGGASEEQLTALAEATSALIESAWSEKVRPLLPRLGPPVEVTSGVVAAEALVVRWRSPRRAWVTPPAYVLQLCDAEGEPCAPPRTVPADLAAAAARTPSGTPRDGPSARGTPRAPRGLAAPSRAGATPRRTPRADTACAYTFEGLQGGRAFCVRIKAVASANYGDAAPADETAACLPRRLERPGCRPPGTHRTPPPALPAPAQSRCSRAGATRRWRSRCLSWRDCRDPRRTRRCPRSAERSSSGAGPRAARRWR